MLRAVSCRSFCRFAGHELALNIHLTCIATVCSLKTDDDCYVRMAYVLRTIQARGSWSGLNPYRVALVCFCCVSVGADAEPTASFMHITRTVCHAVQPNVSSNGVV